MRKVIGIGETVLDIIFKNDQVVNAVPGGSTFNAMVSLGRSGVPVNFLSQTGNDRIGKYVIKFLDENGVNSSYVNITPNGKSPISLAFLDEQNKPDYLFYHDQQHDEMEFNYPDVQRDDIVLFGSYFAINPDVRAQVDGFLKYAKEQGAILYYDVNFRPSHRNDIMKITPNLIENLEYADIVRGSDEDFDVLYQKPDSDKVYQAEISFFCKKLILTQGAKPVVVHSDNGFRKEYAVNEDVQTVSTIGAGDNFNAGFIYGMLKYGVTQDDIDRGLSEEQWDKIIACGQVFSAECCKDIYNYVSPEFGQKMKY